MDRHMQCADAQELADAFVAGELDGAAATEMARHLDTCPACQTDIASRRAVRAQLRSAFLASDALAPRTDWAAQLAARLQTQGVVQPAPARRWWTPGLALAATLLLAATATLYIASGVRGAAALAEMARLALGDHRNCAITFALSEQPIRLPEAATRFDAAYQAFVNIPADSFVARGGTVEVVDRHSCVYAGRRFAHVVMRYQGQIVSLLITTEPGGALSRLPLPSHGNSAAPPIADGSDIVSAGRAGGHMVFFVGDGGNQLVRDVAAAVSPAVYAALSGV